MSIGQRSGSPARAREEKSEVELAGRASYSRRSRRCRRQSQSNPIQPDPIQSNPIQFDPIQSNSIRLDLILTRRTHDVPGVSSSSARRVRSGARGGLGICFPAARTDRGPRDQGMRRRQRRRQQTRHEDRAQGAIMGGNAIASRRSFGLVGPLLLCTAHARALESRNSRNDALRPEDGDRVRQAGALYGVSASILIPIVPPSQKQQEQNQTSLFARTQSVSDSPRNALEPSEATCPPRRHFKDTASAPEPRCTRLACGVTGTNERRHRRPEVCGPDRGTGGCCCARA